MAGCGLAVAGEHLVEGVGGWGAAVLQPLNLLLHRLVFGLDCFIAFSADQADLVSDGGQALVGVVLPLNQAVLGAAGHHAIRLVGALGHQVVNEHADVALIPPEDHRRPSQQL